MKYKFTLILLSFLMVATLTQCGKDKCKTVTCQNGGTCDDGTCKCTQGYGGTDCSKELRPKFANIESVELTTRPGNKPDGSSWGSNDTIYFELFESSNFTKIFNSGRTIFSGTPYTISDFYDLNNAKVSNLHLSTDFDYTFVFSYKDDIKTQTIINYTLTPYTEGQKFPSTISFSTAQGYAGKLKLKYEW